MAIAFARYLGRAAGCSAVRSAAYNERAALTDERTGERFSFAHRDAPEHHEVLLPEGADERLRDSAMLWNAAEAAEKRKDAQVAREIVLTLPADRELTAEDRIELARSFAQQHFVAKGLAVQLDVHAPHEGSAESERANHHAHLLITTRRIEGDHLAARKARDVEPVVRAVAGRPVVAEGEAWGAVWREHQDRYFQAHGLELRVDPLATHAQEHLGPVRMRVVDAEANVRAEEIAAANRAAARDPDQVLATLTRENATFTERELDRLLARHLHDEQEHLAVKATVFGHRDVLALHDPATGEDVRRYTTRQVRAQERTALADAARVARGRQRAVEAGAQEGALETRSLREDQRRAFEHAVAAGGLKIIEGRAGTGKSHTLQAVRDAHERAGCRVLGLAPTNAVAQDLKTEGFAEAGTVHSALFRLKNGLGEAWSARTVVIVDEAAMLDARVTGELLHEARRSGAKVILAGDDRQLTSIERGGLFAELRQRHGSVEISQVTRQRADWQRQAARDLAEGRIGEAVHAFARHGAISWSRTQDEALERLVARWTADTAAEPAATRFVFAYTNADVDRLNTALWQVRRERGEFGTEHRFATRHGAMEFAVGDRVQLTATLKRAGLYNGQAGTITGIDAATGVIRARLDGPAGGEGREVSWSAREFDGFRHGHAGTIDKGQGRTLDHTYLHHSHHWRHASSYVALTRQRERATIFAATETARDVGQLARQMSRSEVRAASVAWATRDELPARLRIQADAPKIEPVGVRADRADVATGRPAEGYRATTTRRGLLTAPAVRMEPRSADLGWLIPPRLSPDGRDSLGRRLDPGSVATVVAADRAVQREGEALKHYLQGTYRDLPRAEARLQALVERDGFTSAVQRLTADPGQLGELLGKTGLLAGRATRQERARALHVAEAVGPGVARLGEARATAERGYRASVAAQLSADTTGVPRLSAKARAAVGTVHAAENGKAHAAAWRVVQGDQAIAGELKAFTTAVEARFGAEGVRAMLRAQQPGAKPFAGGASVAPDQRRAIAELGQAVAVIRAGQRAVAGQAQAERVAQRASYGARLKL